MIKVCIKKDNQGQYSVGTESEQEDAMDMSGKEGMMGATQGQAGMQAPQPEAPENEDANMQPARDLNDALMIAGKLLSQKQGQGNSPFDEGLKKVLPQRQGMM